MLNVRNRLPGRNPHLNVSKKSTETKVIPVNAHQKKMVAPIVITVLLSAYMLTYFIVILAVPMPLWAKILIGLVPLGLLGASIAVLIQRIKEIRSGEEDDLSQY